MLMPLTNRHVYLGNQHKDIWAVNIKKCSKTLVYSFVTKVKVRYLKDLNNSFFKSQRNRSRPRLGSLWAGFEAECFHFSLMNQLHYS